MKLNRNYISKFTDSLLRNQEKFQALKDIGNKKNIPYQISKCKEKLTEEYKFWLGKSANMLRTNKLADLNRDIERIKKLESLKDYKVEDIKMVNIILQKYGL